MAACYYNLNQLTINANATMSVSIGFGGFPHQDAGTMVFMAAPKTEGRLEVIHQEKAWFGDANGFICYIVTIKNNSNKIVRFTLQGGIVCQ